MKALHFLADRGIDASPVKAIVQWQERCGAFLEDSKLWDDPSLFVIMAGVQAYQALSELRASLQAATFGHIASAHAHRRFAVFSDFMYLVGDIMLSTSKKERSVANSVLKQVRQCLIKADILCAPDSQDEDAYDLLTGPTILEWMSEVCNSWPTAMDQRTVKQSAASRASDFKSLVTFTSGHEGRQKFIRTRFNTVMERKLPAMAKQFKDLTCDKSFALYLRLHAIWQAKADMLDFVVMESVDSSLSSKCSEAIIQENASDSALQVVAALEKAHSKLEKMDDGKASSGEKFSEGSAHLVYSHDNVDRVKASILSPAHGMTKKLILHIAQDKDAKLKELKILRLVCSAQSQHCGGVFEDSPKASLLLKQLHEDDKGKGTFPTLEPVAMLRQIVFANRRPTRVHDDALTALYNARKKLGLYLTRYTLFGQDLGSDDSDFAAKGFTFQSSVVTAMAKGEWAKLHLVKEICNFVRGAMQGYEYDSVPKGEEYTDLRSLLVAQRYLPTWLEALGVDADGPNSLVDLISEGINFVVDAEVLREDVALHFLDKQQGRMDRAIALAAEAFTDSVWSEDPLAEVVVDFVQDASSELEDMADEMSSTLADFKRCCYCVAVAATDLDLSGGIGSRLQSLRMPPIAPRAVEVSLGISCA